MSKFRGLGKEGPGDLPEYIWTPHKPSNYFTINVADGRSARGLFVKLRSID